MKPLLLIKHDAVESCGVAIPTLEAEGIEHLVIEAWDERAPRPGVEEISGVVEFGGGMHVDDDHVLPSLSWERSLTREAVERGVPYLGSCLGAQILARALDAPVFTAPAKEIGFTLLRPTAAAKRDPILNVYEEGDMVFHWHEDTFELPAGAELLATGDVIPAQAFRVGERAWGLQFHFELDAPELDIWLNDAERGGDDLKAAWGKSAAEVRDEAKRHIARHEEQGREVFRRFAHIVRRAGA